MKIQTISVNKINPAPYNPRKDLKPDDTQYKQLLRSMEDFGCIQPLVWNRRTGNLVGGHQRFKILLAQGKKQVTVSIVDLCLEKEKALNVALNKINGDWDRQKLAKLLDELVKTPDIDVELTGFQVPEIEQLLSDILDDDTEEDFDIESQLTGNFPIVTRPGELIALVPDGRHRLFCGDVTKPSHVNKLMGRYRAQLCHTDPPYGVNYDRNNRPSAKKHRKTSSQAIVNDDLTPNLLG